MIHSANHLNTKELIALRSLLNYQLKEYKKGKVRLRQSVLVKRAMKEQGFFDTSSNKTISFYLSHCKSLKRELRKTSNLLKEKMYG